MEQMEQMIPVTEYTITAVAALIYNHAYNQDPDAGWLANDEHSAPGHAPQWLEWSKHLVQVLQEQPQASDEDTISQTKQRVDTHKVGSSWDTIWMHQTEKGDEYSTITYETDNALPLVRDFLQDPWKYVEVNFLENDPAYLAYLEAPV
ncbi:MAG: hypothetical protein ACRDHW_00325 [Ktedonobacteraceae bacterium]